MSTSLMTALAEWIGVTSWVADPSTPTVIKSNWIVRYERYALALRVALCALQRAPVSRSAVIEHCEPLLATQEGRQFKAYRTLKFRKVVDEVMSPFRNLTGE